MFFREQRDETKKNNARYHLLRFVILCIRVELLVEIRRDKEKKKKKKKERKDKETIGRRRPRHAALNAERNFRAEFVHTNLDSG